MIGRKDYNSIIGALQKIKDNLESYREKMVTEEGNLKTKQNEVIEKINYAKTEQIKSENTARKLADLLGV